MYKVSKYVYLAIAAIALICGFMLALNPHSFANSVCRVIGIICLVGGIMKVIDSRNAHAPVNQNSVITLAVGALLLIVPGLVLRFISIFAGIVLIAYCLPRLKSALDARKLNSHGWEVSLGLSIGGIALGVLLIIGGASIATIIVRILGIALIAIGAWMGFTIIKGNN